MRETDYGNCAGNIFKFLFSSMLHYLFKWGNTWVPLFWDVLSHMGIEKWGAHLNNIYKYAIKYYSFCLDVNPSKVDYTHSNILKIKYNNIYLRQKQYKVKLLKVVTGRGKYMPRSKKEIQQNYLKQNQCKLNLVEIAARKGKVYARK